MWRCEAGGRAGSIAAAASIRRVRRRSGRSRSLCAPVEWPDNIEETEDPYSFGTLLGDVDLHLISEGTHRRLGECLGAQLMTLGGVSGVRFAVWAPNAQRVSVVGDFNTWDGRRHPMRLRHSAGSGKSSSHA